MNGNGADKKYESLKILGRQPAKEGEGSQSSSQVKQDKPSSLSDGMYYEIEYDSSPIPGVGKFVAKPQKIAEPEKDAIRDIFGQMRDIARARRSTYSFSRFYNKRIHSDNAATFYKQGMFMKDFTDDYTGNAPFSQYFPCYQMMGYEQLRTYFTWRTEVRKGAVSDTSLSYAFIYIYELLENIGVSDPQDGIDRLMSFWQAFRVHNDTIDKYMIGWLKDYHIYYELAQPFSEFIEGNNLAEYYPGFADIDDSFGLFCSISKYDIRKSVFFGDGNAKLIEDCWCFVASRLRQIFAENGINFDECIFQPRRMSAWAPFENALFYPWMRQADRRVVLSKHEIYICSNNEWTFSTNITAESGKQLVGYIMKLLESVLRNATSYKYKLSADIGAVTHPAIEVLKEAGISLERVITGAVQEFYREATKTVVTVNPDALSTIRREALATQEKLIVEEQEDGQAVQVVTPPLTPPVLDEAEGLKNILADTEIKALAVLLRGDMDIKRFADECGIMLEVLVDGINEKAMDFMGDSLIDEDFVLYEDYREQIEELIG